MLIFLILGLFSGVWGHLDSQGNGCEDSCTVKGDSRSPSQMSNEDFLASNCFCDEGCPEYGDCCKDKYEEANTISDKQWMCGSLAAQKEQLDVYMVGSCPSGWSNQSVARRCHRDYSPYDYILDVPVISTFTNHIYANIFCAHCHNDTNDLMPNTMRLMCPKFMPDCRDSLENATYRPRELLWTMKNIRKDARVLLSIIEQDDPWHLVVKHGFRRCRHVEDTCNMQDYEEDASDVTDCPEYANYTYVFADSWVVYKNPLCAACKDDSLEYLECNLTGMPTKVNERRRGCCGSSFALLLDFDEVHGEWVGTTDLHKSKIISQEGGNLPVNDSETLECNTLTVYPPNYSLFPNGSVHIHKLGMVVQKEEYIFVNSDDNTSVVVICYEEDEDNVPFWRFSVVQSHLTLVCIGLSVACLAAHIAVYSSVPKLRNLPGRNLLSLAASLLMAQLLFLGIDQVPYQGLCEAMAVIMHFSFLAAFFWMNVMAVDICRTFTSPYYQHDAASQDKNYRRYSGYAWVLPSVIVAIALLLDHSSIAPSLSPRYGHGLCWISRRRALLVFFALPMAVLLFENIIFFVLTARGICRTVQAAQVARRCSDRIRFYLYIKLALLMGLGWLLGFAAAYANSEPLWLMFIILNASQGVFILVAFSLKRKVLRLVIEKLPFPLRKRSHTSLQTAATSATNLTIAITKLSSSSSQLNLK